MEKVAAHVDAKIQEVLDESKVSLVDGAVLGALNIADEYFKEVEASETCAASSRNTWRRPPR